MQNEIDKSSRINNSHDIPVFNKSWLIKRLKGDKDFADELIKTYLSDVPALLDTIKEAFDRKEASKVRCRAHALKGASSEIGALALRNAALHVENAAKNDALENASPLIDELDLQFQLLKKFLEK